MAQAHVLRDGVWSPGAQWMASLVYWERSESGDDLYHRQILRNDTIGWLWLPYAHTDMSPPHTHTHDQSFQLYSYYTSLEIS